MSRKCSNCGFDNRDTASFCAHCKASLPLGGAGWAPPVASGMPAPAGIGAAPLAMLNSVSQRFPISGGTTLVGRNTGCPIVLADASVSGSHAEISWDGTQYVVRDLGSTNGTWVNQRRVLTNTPLAPGAQVFFGTVGFTFEIAAAGGLPHPSSSSGTQPISPQQMQLQVVQGASAATGSSAAPRRGGPRVSGAILSDPTERQEQPPPDPARTLVMLAVVVLFVGLLCSFIATVAAAAIVLLICGGVALLFIVPFLWMPIQMAFSGMMGRLRDEKPVTVVSLEVKDEATGQVYDVGFIRRAGMGGGGLHHGDKVEVWGKQRGGNQIQASKIRVFESHGQTTSVLVPIRKGWPLAIGLVALAAVVAVVAMIVTLGVSAGVIKLPSP